jgi:hypothetical protein
LFAALQKQTLFPKPENLTKTYAVNTYVNAMTRGKLDGFSDVLDQTVKFSMLRGEIYYALTKSKWLIL